MGVVNRLVPWLIGLLVLSLSLGALYVVAQQVERLGADDAGERLATAVASGVDPLGAGIPTAVDLATSDAVFFVEFDAGLMPIAGTGFLDGALAVPPEGVLRTALDTGGNHVTWETPDGRRFATVELRSGDHVIMAGQSLAPTEARIATVGGVVILVWVLGVVLLAAGAAAHLGLARATARADHSG